MNVVTILRQTIVESYIVYIIVIFCEHFLALLTGGRLGRLPRRASTLIRTETKGGTPTSSFDRRQNSPRRPVSLTRTAGYGRKETWYKLKITTLCQKNIFTVTQHCQCLTGYPLNT